MDNEQRRGIARSNLILGTCMAIAGLFCLMLVSGQKDTYSYYLSSSHRSKIDMLTLLSWGMLLFGGFDVASGLIILNSLDSAAVSDVKEASMSETSDTSIECYEGEITKKEWDPSHSQIEWIHLKQRNGAVVRLQHNISDNVSYKIGVRYEVHVQEHVIVENVSRDNVTD